MTNNFQKPRGTQDLYGLNLVKRDILINLLEQIARNYGFEKIVTPTFEHKKVFVRSLGETSDLVKKEFFELLSHNSKDQYVLRPENTASIVRLVANEKLLMKHSLPLRFFYYGSMFRYERPQAGRLREFSQFGIEVIGTNSFLDDIELIQFCQQIIKELNLSDHVELIINYLGDEQTKIVWNDLLKKHFANYYDQLSAINQERVNTNPLRILDDKHDQDLTCVKNAPNVFMCLSNEQKQTFNQITNCLEQLQIKFSINPNLVRGLDYYTGLVFEYVFHGSGLEGQKTIIGGGRYAKLLSEFNAPDHESIGFGLGIDRLLVALNSLNWNPIIDQKIDLYLATLVDQIDCQLLELIAQLRIHKINVFTNYKIKKLNKHFKFFDHFNKPLLLIYGPKEQANQTIIFQNRQNSFEQKFNLNQIEDIVVAINQQKLLKIK